MARAAADFRLVIVMAASEEQAVRMARVLVEERLAACVNIVGPARSIYRWRDVVEEASEQLMLIKTRARAYPKLERRVRELHSYEVPEIIALPLAAGSQPYLQWLRESTLTPASPGPRRARRRTPR